MKYILDHTVLIFLDHICWWDVAALAILIGVCVYAYKHLKAMKTMTESLEERMAGSNVAEAVGAAGEAVTNS